MHSLRGKFEKTVQITNKFIITTNFLNSCGDLVNEVLPRDQVSFVSPMY